MFDTCFDPIVTWQNAYVDVGKYSGSSVLIQLEGKECFFSAVGLRDIENNQPFTRDTVVRLYSMTKPIVSLAIMILVERDMLRLDTQLDEILPEFSNPCALIPGATRIDQVTATHSPTILQLLTHQAGFSYGFNSGVLADALRESDVSFAPDNGTLAQQISALSKFPLAFPPGARWEYSTSIDVLGHVIERVGGIDLASFVRLEILDPLGMDETGFCVRDDQIERFAALYSVESADGFHIGAQESAKAPQLHLSERAKDSAFTRTTLYSGGGGLVGTIDDFALFTNMLLRDGEVRGRQLVSVQTARLMRRNHLPGEIADMGPTSFAEQPMKGTGFGLGGSVLLNPKRAGIAGSIGDFSWGGIASTYFWIDPTRKLSVVFLTQLLPSSAYPSRAELKSLVMDALHL